MRNVKTDGRGWVCALGAVILSCSAAFLSGCAGLVSGANNTSPSTLIITNVQTGAITTSGSQVIWTTNVPANSSVDYGTTTAYGNTTPVDSAMVTSHQVTLTGLAAGTTYYYQVNSSDSKGNNGHHGNTFKTAGFTMSGTITPTAAGNGASVALSGPASATTTADSSGNYTFSGLPNGTFTMTPSHSGFTFTPGSQSMAINGANVTGVNFTGTSQTFTISGTISPVAGGSGATVTLSGAASATTTANSSGAYTLTGLTSGSYTITPSNVGYTFTPPTQNVTVSATNVSGVNFTDNAVAVAPTITTAPANQTVTAGQTATFTVVAAGTAPLSYQWQKNGVNITGATSAGYTTPVTATSDSGSTFDVMVSNTVGTVTSAAATLTVSAAPVAPTITTAPANQTVSSGQTATFTVVAAGTAPLSYQWQKNGVNIAGATGASYTTPATATSDSGSTFRVVVTNTVGTVTSAAATLTVNAAPVAPTITTAPANQTVTAGQTATFTVVAAGTAPLSYQWQKNGVNIAGATAASYTTPTTTTSDSAATFDVVVTNTAGTVTSSAATLTVNVAPVAPTITTAPANQTVTAGQTATFTVVAAGTAPLSYQWQKNGVNIAGATAASYTTPTTTTSDSGSTFDVVVSNTAGTVTSAAATLTVNPAPAPVIQPSPTSLSFANDPVGTTLSQVLIIKNTGTATLTITQITATGSGFSVSGFSLPLSVNAGQQTTITASLLPTTVGTVSGNISIVSNAPTSPTSVPLSGTSIAAVLTLGINPSTGLSFGNVTTGTSSPTQNVTITNTGNSNVTISQINLTGAGYSMTGGSAPVTLTPTQSITLVVQFSPTTAGSVNGNISVVSNATGSPATITLSGTGVAPVQHSVSLSWTASTSTVSGYNVYRSTVSGGSYTKINSSLVAVLSYTDSAVQSGTTYYYVTTAVDSTGSESTLSNEVSAPIP
jgi:invasion protein IalB